MKRSVLERNRDLSERYVQPVDSKNLKLNEFLLEILKSEKVMSLIDLGCGDGIFIHAVKRNYPHKKIVGVDISPRRINGLQKKFPKSKFICADVCSDFIKQKFDFVYSSQVIEHVEDDKMMVNQIKKLVKNKKYVFVSSVIKKPFAVYKYRNNGKFVLDPTHEREYKNKKDFLKIFEDDFKLIKYRVFPVERKIFGLMIKIPGYHIIEGLGTTK